MTGTRMRTRMAYISMAFLASASAQAGAWSSSVALSTGGQGWQGGRGHRWEWQLRG